jgi:hypothetical protein
LVVNLDGYVTVNQRLIAALADHPDMRIVEEPHTVETIGDQTFLCCTVWVFLTPDDSRPVRGSVLEPMPGRTPYTKNSELMVGFTSAVGRALGYLGYGIDKSIASSDEVAARVGTDRELDDAMPAVKREQLGSRAKPVSKAAQAALERGGGADSGEATSAVLDAFPGATVQRRQAPTPKMAAFYRKLCAERGVNPDEAALEDFDACKTAIDRMVKQRVD